MVATTMFKRTDRRSWAKVAEYFWTHTALRLDTGCREWEGSVNEHGYGQLWVPGFTHSVGAHQVGFYFEHWRWPDPDLELDHLCRNPPCVEAAHLEEVTHRENVLRGMAPGAVLHRAGVCHNGHPATPENVHVRANGTRLCRICDRSRALAYYYRKTGRPWKSST